MSKAKTNCVVCDGPLDGPVRGLRAYCSACGTRDRARIQSGAKAAVAKAIRTGLIRKPETCSACGTKPSRPALLEGHHGSYEQSKWLDVQWLCVPCHRAVHLDPRTSAWKEVAR